MPAKTSAREPATPTFMDAAMMPRALVSELYWMSNKLPERRLYHLAVSSSQARVLAVLHYSTQPIKPSLVATLLFQETQSITGITNRIESRGWAIRLPDQNDRRAVGLQLSAAGRKLTSEIVEIMRELYDELFAAALGRTERGQVETSLRKVRALGFKRRRQTSSCLARSSSRSGRTKLGRATARRRARLCSLVCRRRTVI
jgi:DNA-binding MarR family transcriptional regulator